MNTMAKKWCFVVLALAMVLVGTASLAGCSSDDGEEDTKKAITITMDDAKNLTLDAYKYYDITLTGEYNNLSMQYLTQKLKATSAKISLDMSAVTGNVTISNMSGNTNLISIVLPDVLKTVPASAFNKCSSLETVTIGKQVTSIGQSAFSYCNLQEITLPESLTTIGWDAFSNCARLTEITIPDSVTDIHTGYNFGSQSGTFGGCSALKTITIGKSLSDISYGDFTSCLSLETITIAESNTAYKSNDNMIYSKDDTKLIFCPAGKTGQVVIPATVTEISAGAFYTCTKISAITIGESVQTIGENAFYCCTNITTIEIPASVTRIGARAFSGCTNLKTAYFAVPTGWSSAGSMTDAEQNANYLVSDSYRTWKRAE